MAMNPGLAAFIAKKKGKPEKEGKAEPGDSKKEDAAEKKSPADKIRSHKLKQFAGADFSKGK